MNRGDGREPVPGRAARSEKAGIVARPALLDRIGMSARVTVVSGPPGSGKTVLLRSWAGAADVTDRVGWVALGREERAPQRFWTSVVAALRDTAAGAELVQAVTAAPGLDGWELVERLLKDVAVLREPVWLVLDDVHELAREEVLYQLELLILRAPPELRFVLATRDDMPLGLHRLRLEGELSEIRAADLRLSRAEGRELLARAGLRLPDSVTDLLHERTEGWATGLRLAALSLAGRANPEDLAIDFSGSERTVAEYLLSEVLDRQPENVRKLLVFTSVLETVNGELADLLTGDQGGERVLLDLEQTNALTVAVDAGRTWFRYHRLFADLLRSELQRTAPSEVMRLHRIAAGWYVGHGSPVEAIRHARAAGDTQQAARLLADRWTALHLDGQTALAHELLAGFSRDQRAADAELAALAALDDLAVGHVDSAERNLLRADRCAASVPAGRGGQFQMLLGVARLVLARQRGDLPAVVARAAELRELVERAGTAVLVLGAELHALSLNSVGIAEVWAGRFAEAAAHLEQVLDVARRIGRPYLEFMSLAFLGVCVARDSPALSSQRCLEAMELARRHGWAGESAAGVACVTLGVACAWQARLGESEQWVLRAESAIRAETDPSAALGVRYARGLLEIARGRHIEAVKALESAETLAGGLDAPRYLLVPVRALSVLALVGLGETRSAESALTGTDERFRDCAEMRIAAAALLLARDEPQAAFDVIAPAADGSAAYLSLSHDSWHALAFLLKAAALHGLGDGGGAERALEDALDAAETVNALTAFLLCPFPDLMARHPAHRTSHGALVAEITGLLIARVDAGHAVGVEPLSEPLSGSELRVLRYLPTNLTAPEIAGELSVSLNTVKTHMRNIYAKLHVHSRAEAVERARFLGFLA